MEIIKSRSGKGNGAGENGKGEIVKMKGSEETMRKGVIGKLKEAKNKCKTDSEAE